MRIPTPATIGPRLPKGLGLGSVLLLVVASAVAIAAYLIATQIGLVRLQAAPAARVAAPPTATEFGRKLIGVTNAYSIAHGEPARVAHTDCVEASPGHYMCSYAVLKPNRAPECHVVQARWTPTQASTITVTLAGRASKCGTLREAIQSLD